MQQFAKDILTTKMLAQRNRNQKREEKNFTAENAKDAEGLVKITFLVALLRVFRASAAQSLNPLFNTETQSSHKEPTQNLRNPRKLSTIVIHGGHEVGRVSNPPLHFFASFAFSAAAFVRGE
jgi:hypothetical protein